MIPFISTFPSHPKYSTCIALPFAHKYIRIGCTQHESFHLLYTHLSPCSIHLVHTTNNRRPSVTIPHLSGLTCTLLLHLNSIGLPTRHGENFSPLDVQVPDIPTSEMPRESSVYSVPSSSSRRNRSREDLDELTRDFNESLSFQPRDLGYEPGLRDRDISPYHPQHNPRRLPRADSGYNSRDRSRDQDRDYPIYTSNLQSTYLAPRARRCSRPSSSNNLSGGRSTGQRTPSGRASRGAPPRETRISDSGSVIHNDSGYIDAMKSSKEDDSEYYIGSSYRPRPERRLESEPRHREPRRQRDSRDPRYSRIADGTFREEDEKEHQQEQEYRRR